MVMGCMARGGCVVVMIDVAFAFVDVAPLLLLHPLFCASFATRRELGA
jgi:hypothetical protein